MTIDIRDGTLCARDTILNLMGLAQLEGNIVQENRVLDGLIQNFVGLICNKLFESDTFEAY